MKTRAEARIKIDPDSLVIESVPPPERTRPAVCSKYESLFRRLVPGECVRCKPAEVPTLAKALGLWLKREEMDEFATLAKRVCDDGHGRVWLVQLSVQEREQRKKYRLSRKRRAVERTAAARSEPIRSDPDKEPAQEPAHRLGLNSHLPRKRSSSSNPFEGLGARTTV